jgi:HlyD family secretion protein
MNTRKFIIVLVLMLVGAYLIMTFLTGFRKTPVKRPQQEVKRYVRAQKVAYRDIESNVTAAGRLSSTQQVDVITEVQGQIMTGRVPMKKGQSFKRGDLLFKVYDEQARLGLLSRKSRFLNAIANLLPDFKVDFPSSYPLWSRFLDIINIEKDLPPLPKIESTKEKIFLAGRNILSDYYTIKSEEVRLKKYAITAPFSGTFTDVMLEVGSVANPGSRIAKIIRTDKLELEVPLKVKNADWVKKGDLVQVATEDGSREWQGKVARKSQFIDADSQSISIFVALESTPENPLYLGLYLKAIFPGVMVRNAMQIPRNAVFNNNEVFIVKDGRLSKQEIRIHKVDEKTLIFSGLSEGWDLVVEPLINATENSMAEIIKEKS